MEFEVIYRYATKCHDDANCNYDGQSYMVHVDMVVDVLSKFITVFKHGSDRDNAIAGVICHDTIEDAKQTYNNVKDVIGKDAADIVLAVTDVPAENRLMRHLLTMPKTVRDYRAIIVKMADMYSHASYSKEHGSSMFVKYAKEYEYRRPIFKAALKQYMEYLNEKELNILWLELDEVHNFNK